VTRHPRLLSLAAAIIALAALVILLFPLYAVVIASLENNSQLIGNHYYFFPPTPSLANYRSVISSQGGHILSSLIIGVGTAALTLVISLPAAHALARYRFRVTALIAGTLLAAQILPSIVIANSLFVIYHHLHLLNTYPGLIVADGSYAIPFSILVLRAFMLQAARVDGANEWRAFTRVVLPMSRTAIITVAVFAFLNGWGDFIFALTMLSGSSFEPITLSIYSYIGEFSQNLGAAMALCVFGLLPAAVLLIAAQRYIASGLTVGSVKG
jgi:multiple sugar transport system permease protein